MSKLSELRKQIATLEAEFARTAKEEMAKSVSKVKSMMDSLGVTLEHLGAPPASAVSKAVAATKSSVKGIAAKKTRAKRAGAGVPKYADPKTGKTWTGFGRAPAWIADAKNRDVFLVSGSAVEPAAETMVVAKKAKAVAKKGKAVATKASAPAEKAFTRAAKNAAAPEVAAPKATTKKAAAKKPPVKRASVKTAMAKREAAKAAPAKKGASKSAASKKIRSAAAPAPAPAAAGSSEGAAAAAE